MCHPHITFKKEGTDHIFRVARKSMGGGGGGGIRRESALIVTSIKADSKKRCTQSDGGKKMRSEALGWGNCGHGNLNLLTSRHVGRWGKATPKEAPSTLNHSLSRMHWGGECLGVVYGKED